MALVLCVVGCEKRAKVIPPAQLTDIYADMFLADQWLSTSVRERKVSDTMYFYRPIFEKYGYTVQDYDASVSYYIRYPNKYAKLLKAAASKLDKQRKHLQRVEDYFSKRPRWEPFTPPRIVLRDSLAWASDTTILWAYVDTLALRQADSVAFAVADSLAAVADSLAAVADSLAASADSLAASADSVALDSLVAPRDSALVQIDTSLKLIPFKDDTTTKIDGVLLLHGPDDPAPAGHRGKREGPRRKSE